MMLTTPAQSGPHRWHARTRHSAPQTLLVPHAHRRRGMQPARFKDNDKPETSAAPSKPQGTKKQPQDALKETPTQPEQYEHELSRGSPPPTPHMAPIEGSTVADPNVMMVPPPQPVVPRKDPSASVPSAPPEPESPRMDMPPTSATSIKEITQSLPAVNKPPPPPAQTQDPATPPSKVSASQSKVSAIRLEAPVTPTVTGPVRIDAPTAAAASDSTRTTTRDTPSFSVPGPMAQPGGPGPVLLPAAASWTAAVLGSAWLAVSLSLVFVPKATLHFLFPSAVGQFAAKFLAVLWGAALLPFATAHISLKEVCDSNAGGTAGSHQLAVAVLLGSALTGVVVLQAVSLSHWALNWSVGLASVLGLAYAVWLTSKGHGHALPVPDVKSVASAFLSSLPPRTFASLTYTAIGLGFLGVGWSVLRSSSPVLPPVLLGGAAETSSLAVFVGRAVGGALMATGVLCTPLAAAADRLMLPARSAQTLNIALAASSLLMSLLLFLGMMVDVVNPTAGLIVFMLGQLAAGVWATSAIIAPNAIQGGPSLFPRGSGWEFRPAQAKAVNAGAAQAPPRHFWSALAAPVPSGDQHW